MARPLDDLLVILALLASVGYAAAALGPRSLRRRAAALAARSLLGAPAFLHLQRLGQRLETWSAAGESSTCGGCGSCGAESKAPAAQSDPAPEVRVPLANIGRRGS